MVEERNRRAEMCVVLSARMGGRLFPLLLFSYYPAVTGWMGSF